MQKQTTIKDTVLKNIPWFAGLFVAILNLWLAAQLSPLAKDIEFASRRVEAIENWIDKHDQSNADLNNKLQQIFQQLGELKGLCK